MPLEHSDILLPKSGAGFDSQPNEFDTLPKLIRQIQVRLDHIRQKTKHQPLVRELRKILFGDSETEVLGSFAHYRPGLSNRVFPGFLRFHCVTSALSAKGLCLCVDTLHPMTCCDVGKGGPFLDFGFLRVETHNRLQYYHEQLERPLPGSNLPDLMLRSLRSRFNSKSQQIDIRCLSPHYVELAQLFSNGQSTEANLATKLARRLRLPIPQLSSFAEVLKRFPEALAFLDKHGVKFDAENLPVARVPSGHGAMPGRKLSELKLPLTEAIRKFGTLELLPSWQLLLAVCDHAGVIQFGSTHQWSLGGSLDPYLLLPDGAASPQVCQIRPRIQHGHYQATVATDLAAFSFERYRSMVIEAARTGRTVTKIDPNGFKDLVVTMATGH